MEKPYWPTLAKDCVEGALSIVDLCQMLHDHGGLARASYTEFSSCRVALLAIIAQMLNEQSERLSSSLKRGLGMIRHMMIGNESAKAEVSVIEALTTATEHLRKTNSNSTSSEVTEGFHYRHGTLKTLGSTICNRTQELDTMLERPASMSQTEEIAYDAGPFAGITDLDLNEILASFPLEQGGFGYMSPLDFD